MTSADVLAIACALLALATILACSSAAKWYVRSLDEQARRERAEHLRIIADTQIEILRRRMGER